MQQVCHYFQHDVIKVCKVHMVARYSSVGMVHDIAAALEWFYFFASSLIVNMMRLLSMMQQQCNLHNHFYSGSVSLFWVYSAE